MLRTKRIPLHRPFDPFGMVIYAQNATKIGHNPQNTTVSADFSRLPNDRVVRLQAVRLKVISVLVRLSAAHENRGARQRVLSLFLLYRSLVHYPWIQEIR